MYIYKKISQDGKNVSVHYISRFDVQGEVSTVLLYSIDPSDEVPDAKFHTHSLPMEAVSAAPYPECVTNWLVGPGGVLEGGTVIQGEDLTLEAKQDILTKQVNTHRDNHIYGGIVFNGLGIDTDAVSLRNIMGTSQLAALALMGQQPFQISWRCSDNSMANFNASDFIGVAQAVMVHVQACYQRSWELKSDIETATDETIDTIDPSTGWPA